MANAPESEPNAFQRRAHKISDLLSEVIDSLRFYAGTGYSGGDCGPDNLERIRRWSDADCLRLDQDVVSAGADAPACAGCSLREYRSSMIAGAGPGRAKLMFVAGYPSFATDKERSPYAGEPGHLLTRIIAAMKLTPDDVFFSHVVKCRPPGGGQPAAGDMQRCLPSLEQEIRTVAPRVICVLGEYAARALLGGNEPVEKRRGRFYEREGMALMITWHPEDILDDPSRKRPVWEDIQKVMARLDISSAGQP